LSHGHLLNGTLQVDEDLAAFGDTLCMEFKREDEE
jgi:hypothetical protein